MILRCCLASLALLAAPARATVSSYADYWMGDSIPASNGSTLLPRDSSGNGRHLMFKNGSPPTLSPAGGPFNDAFYTFSGGSGGFYGAAGSWNPPEDNVGVEVWARTTNLTQANRHLFGTGSNLAGLNLGFDGTGGRGWFGSIAGIAYVGASPAYHPGDWVHLALVRDGGVTTFYVNRAIAGATSTTAPTDANGVGNGALHVAVNSGGNACFAGDLAMARVFTFAAGQFDPATDFTTQAPPAPVIVHESAFPTVAGKRYLAKFEVRPADGSQEQPAMTLQAIGAGSAPLAAIPVETPLPAGLAAVPYWLSFTADSASTALRFSAPPGTALSSAEIAGLTVAEPLARPASPTPTAAQQGQIDRRYGLFMHFSINTFNDMEWSDGTLPASSYKPTALDVEQWIQTAYEAGMRYVLVITKHHDGFCVWDSPWTTYDVGSSPVPTDIVAAAAAACRKYGLKLAFYYSLWDRHEPSYLSDTDYDQYMLRQLSELTSHYGPVSELWLDGGWDRANTRWPTVPIYDLVHTLQPDCQIGINWSIGKPGNVDFAAHPSDQVAGDPIRYFPSDFRLGDPYFAKFPDPKTFSNQGSSYYMPFEATITLSGVDKWFFSPTDTTDKSVTDLTRMFYSATAQDNVLVLNAPPDRSGRIRELERNTLFQLRDKLGLTPGQPLPKNLTGAATGIASSTWQGDTANYGPQLALDGNPDTRWASGADATSNLTLEADLGATRTFDRVLIDEYEASPGVGRITAFHLDAWDGNAWVTFHTGTTCGRFSLHDFAPQTTAKVRLVIDASAASPSIWEFQVHRSGHALAAWRRAKFPAADADPAFASESDPDGDGLANRTEFALRSDPLTATSLPRPGVAGDQRVLDLPWNPEASPEDGGIEYSFDLATWYPAMSPTHPGVTMGMPSGNALRWTVDPAQHPLWFYRCGAGAP